MQSTRANWKPVWQLRAGSNLPARVDRLVASPFLIFTYFVADDATHCSAAHRSESAAAKQAPRNAADAGAYNRAFVRRRHPGASAQCEHHGCYHCAD